MGAFGLGGRNFARPYTIEELREIAASVKKEWSILGCPITLHPDEEFYGTIKVGGNIIRDVHPAAYKSIQAHLDVIEENQADFVSLFHFKDSLIAGQFRKPSNYILDGVIDREGDEALTNEKAVPVIQVWLLKNKN